jgi:subtilase family serine protease
MQRRTVVTSVIATGALVISGLVMAPGAGAATARKQIPNSLPSWVAHATSSGRVSSAGRINFRVYLAPNGGLAALKAEVAKVSTPGSSSYRSFLTARQYHAKYDPSSSEVASVASWLKQNGLAVTGVETHKRYISARGSVADTSKAFDTSIGNYRYKGRQVRANSTPLSVPLSVASSILTVTGVNNAPHKAKHQTAPPEPGFRNGRPCSIYYGQIRAKHQADYTTPIPPFNGKTLPYSVCGYTGPQLRSAYEDNLSAGSTGRGVTVAITDAYASPNLAQDANQYAIAHGDGSYGRTQLQQVLPDSFNRPNACDASGWYGEQSLDVEAVHAMAPGARIRYYGAASCFDNDLLATLTKVVDQNKASLVSNSWDDVEANSTPDSILAYEQVFLQGAIQGIGFMYSSGDDGDELDATGIKQVDYPASDPYVTAVGGTSDAVGRNGNFKFQTGWGTHRYDTNKKGQWVDDGFWYGAGGGTSYLFNQPAYQQGVVPGSAGAGRAVPDVAMDADPTTGMLIGETQTFPDGVYYSEYRIGGTSLASPLFAGITANAASLAGQRLGFLNPSIYALAGSDAFNDIQGSPPQAGNVRPDYVNGLDPSDGMVYSVRTFNQDSSLSVAPGWDNVTGVGTANANWITAFAQ